MPPKQSDLSKTEWEIMNISWRKGEAPARVIYDESLADKRREYQTVKTMLDRLVDKGWLERDTEVRPQVFWAAKPQKQTQKALVRDLLDRAFSGSPSELVLQALALRKSTTEELREIRALLDRLEDDT